MAWLFIGALRSSQLMSLFAHLSDSPAAAAVGRRFSHPVVVHSAFPKSGSQSTREMIRQVLGGKVHLSVPKSHGGFGHNVISPKKLPVIRRFFRPCVIYGHIPPTGYNVAQLHKISSSPWFVSIRGLKDVVVSYKEHVDRAGAGPLDFRLSGLSEGLHGWTSMEDAQKFKFIIRFIMPWYVRFVAGWQHIAQTRPVTFVRYEDVVDQPGAIRAMLARELCADPCGNSFGDSMPKVNFNVGEKNRGCRSLSSEICMELERLLEIHPELRDEGIRSYLMQRP